jgi:16S rRNA (cytidine1402-2'-O)-methyltransferase
MQTSFSPGLYVVATPIGNLGDLSPRASAVLEAADVVAAEDTRTTRRLLQPAARTPAMVSLTEHNVEQRTPALLASAREGVVALVSEAGTPAIADPGTRLVDAAHRAGVPVYAVPGPSALAAAISVSGFDGSDVHFLGFLPRKRGERIARMANAASTASTLAFFEAPGRLAATLGDLAEALNDPQAVVCRELTKLHEEVVRGSARELATRFAKSIGECTVVVRCPPAREGGDHEVTVYLAEMKRAGARQSAAAAEAAKRFGCTRQHAYALWPTG